MTQYRFALIACARWETPYITEWLLYHRAIGFEHVYLYCNDDEPTELFQQIEPFIDSPSPFVTFLHYPFQGQQFHMYLHALRHYRHQAEWMMFLDIDEFLVLRDCHNIARYVDRLPPEWDSINFNWIFFGTNGCLTRPGGSVLLIYTRRAADLHPYTKNLTRTARITMDPFDAGHTGHFWHHWAADLAPEMKAVNVLGDPIRPYYENFPAGAQTYLSDPERQQKIMQIGLIHHYHLKSEADFELRRARGLGGNFSAQTAWITLAASGGAREHLRLTNAVEDHTLADFWRARINRAQRVRLVKRPNGPNIALHRPALQSSHSAWSKGKTIAADAALATNGEISGSDCFHTGIEDSPWWRVDLGNRRMIAEIRIYNRLGHAKFADRINPFVIEISDDDVQYALLLEKRDDTPVGGVDGNPFIHRPGSPPQARFVRIRLLRETCLHLDQVEIYEV